jgi:hypothetical protein
MPDYSVRIIGLPVEMAAGGKLARPRRCLSGNHNDANARPALMHLSGKRQAVKCSRQVDVGEEQLNVGIRLEEFERLVAVARFDYLETGVGEHAGAEEARQRLVFDHQNRDR